MKQLVIFILAAAFCCSCSKDDYINVKFDKETFIEQRQLWQASNTKDYEYHLLFGGYNIKIIIENGDCKDEGICNFDYSTIDKVYNTIEEIYNFYNGTKKTDHYFSDRYLFYVTEIFIEYDKINHIPIKIHYLYYVSPGIDIHGIFYYEINDFEKIYYMEY